LFPFFISDCIDYALPLLGMGIMLYLVTNLLCSVGVQEKKAFYRQF